MAKSTVAEFAAAVRQAHPEYNDITDDHQLVDAVLKGHPEYSDDVDLRTYKPSAVLRAPSGRPAGTNPGDVATEARASMAKRSVGGDLPPASPGQPRAILGQGSSAYSVNPDEPVERQPDESVGAYTARFGRNAIKTAGELAIGAAKGAASTGYHTGRLLHVVPKNEDFENALEGENTAQTVGKIGEQVAEYAGAEGAVKGGIAAAGKVLTLPGKVAAGAAVGGAVAKMQGGDASTGALAGSVAPVAEEGVAAASNAIKSKLVASAQQSWHRLLGATRDTNKLTAGKIVPDLVDRGVVVGTRKGALERFSAEVDDLGQKIDDIWQSLPPDAEISAKPIKDAVAEAKKEFQIQGGMKQSTVALKDVQPTDKVVSIDHKGGTAIIESQKTVNIEPGIARNFDRVSALIDAATDDATGNVNVHKLRKVRQVWDEIVGPKGGYVGKDLSLPDRAGIITRREGANAIRAELANAIPDLQAINKEYTFWRRAEKVMRDTVTRTSSQSQHMGEQIMNVAGAAAGAKGGVVKALITGKAAAMFRKVTTSAAWNSVSALTKSRLANAIAAGDRAGATDLIYRVAFATGVQKQREENDAQSNAEDPNE